MHIESKLNELYTLEDTIMEKRILLTTMQSKAIRDSTKVTSQMILECRELLDIFGIPYIISPAEAEAQCAALNKAGLVNGIITDDCDVFLFGGKTVYKNLFHRINLLKNIHQQQFKTH